MAQQTQKTEEAKGASAPSLHIKTQYVTAGKVPGGEVVEVQLNGRMTVRDVFKKAGVESVAGCDIQITGRPASMDDVVEPGDSVLAVAKVRGNE